MNIISGRELTPVQAVILRLMKVFASKCDELGIPWFVCGGTLLGAVRHNGFIPWDDDADFYVPGDAYGELMKCHGIFEYPYFLQNEYTEKDWMRIRGHAQLRDSLTTGFIERDRNRDINKGMFVDIFNLVDVGGGMVDNRFIRQDKTTCPKEWWNGVESVAFEDMTVNVPSGYDGILTKQYGDWRIPRQEPSMHGGVVFDDKTPYVEYFKGLGR